MRAVTIKDAKAHLNELIDAASSGEQVVLTPPKTLRENEAVKVAD